MNPKLNTLFSALMFSGLGLFSYLLLLNYTNLTKDVTEVFSSVGAVVFVIAAFNILGFATIRLGSWINDQYSLYFAARWKIVVVYTLVSLMFLLINYGLLVVAKLLVGAVHPFTFPNGGVRILIIVWLVELVILGLMMANKSIKNSLKLQQEALKLQRENDKANYTALQNQLNPHFLFNSLNTLIAEIEYDPKGAIDFTRNLSDVYRYVLQCQDKPLVTLREELDFARSYLFLHEVRMGNCIHWNVDVDKSYMDSALPPLTLQLLVENVIKHNSITLSRPVEINVSLSGGYMQVSNSINAKKSAQVSGIGLKNLSSRCRLIMGRDICVENIDNIFVVKIPITDE